VDTFKKDSYSVMGDYMLLIAFSLFLLFTDVGRVGLAKFILAIINVAIANIYFIFVFLFMYFKLKGSN
jgi:hypothetical protein